MRLRHQESGHRDCQGSHWVRNTILLLAVLFWSSALSAHSRQENYVYLNVEADNLSGMFEINVNDIRTKLNIDVDEGDRPRLEGMVETADRVQQYLSENFQLSESGSLINLEFQTPTLFEDNADYLRYPFKASLPSGTVLTVFNSIFLTPDMMKNDRLHRSMLVIEYNRRESLEFGSEHVAIVFTPKRLTQDVDLTDPPGILRWQDFLVQGVLHILIGYDHILFITVLLLATVMRVRGGRWKPVSRFRSALWKTLKIVTIFTIAHSITLSLAALGLVNVDAVIVETVIALSIIGMALTNIFPKYATHNWMLIFLFGLFHGLGFASVMGDLQFRNVFLEKILIMFNVGVELGQLSIVIVVFPILFLIRKKSYYKTVVMNVISIIAIMVSLLWVAERTGLIAT